MAFRIIQDPLITLNIFTLVLVKDYLQRTPFLMHNASKLELIPKR